MPAYTQTDRPLKIHTPLGADQLLLAELTGTEGMSRLFHFRLHLLAPVPETVPFEKLLGKSATAEVELAGGGSRFFNGILCNLTQGERDQEFTHYYADLVPRLWLYTQRFRSRVFQEISVPHLLEQELAPLHPHLRCQFHQKPLELAYLVQWQESDFSFLSRLMETVGIFYYFEHHRDHHTLVVTDHAHLHPPLAEGGTVPYRPLHTGAAGPAQVLAWHKRQDIRPARYSSRDDHFELFPESFQVDRATQADVQVGMVSHQLVVEGTEDLESYVFPGRVTERIDEVRPGGSVEPHRLPPVFRAETWINDVRCQAGAIDCLTIGGNSTCCQFLPGHVFELQQHFDGNGKYYLTRVEHRARAAVSAAAPTEERRLIYDNDFACLPVGLPYRPAQVTPRPRILGMQAAVVVGPPGHDVYLDKYGRVKVQFSWDRAGKRDAQSSCWVRVAQDWAGPNWGTFHWPRVGHEVLVAFYNGEPDRPVVVGSLYNATNMPPVQLPADALTTGTKTLTSKGDAAANFSGLAFEDVPGQEHVHLHSERYMTHNVESTLFTNAGQAHHVNVGQVSTRQVGGLPGIDHDLPPAPSGSGSGGAASTADSPAPSTGPLSTGWQMTTSGALGQDLSWVVGWSQSTTIGADTGTTIGHSVSNAFHPLSLVEVATSLGGKIPLVGEWIAPLGGWISGPANPFSGALAATLFAARQSVTVGNALGIQYGSSFTIRHGKSVDYSSPEGGVLKLCTTIAAACYTAISILEVFLPLWNPPSKFEVVAVDAGQLLLNEFLLFVWSGLEIGVGSVRAKVNAVEAAGQFVDQMTRCGALGQGMANVLNAAETVFQTVSSAAGVIPGEKKKSTGKYENNDSLVAFTAPTFLAHAKGGATRPEQRDSNLYLVSTGSKPDGQGYMQLSAKSVLGLYAGKDTVASCRLDCFDPASPKVVFDCGTTGRLSLQSGPACTPNWLLLEPAGIRIISDVGVAVRSADASIHVNDTGLFLRAGSNSMINMTPATISLRVGSSTLMLTSTGLTLNGGTIRLVADGQVRTVAVAQEQDA